MTKARDLANIISGGFTESDIPNLSASKITSGTFADARIADLNASKLTGSIADARIPASAVSQHATTFDDNDIVNDLSTVALRSATTENAIAYNTNSSFIDVFQDSSGIASFTTALRNASEYVTAQGASFGSQTAVAQGTGTAIGNFVRLDKAFDGNTNQSASTGSEGSGNANNTTHEAVGKDWGSGNTKFITGFKWRSSNNDGVASNGGGFFLLGSNSNSIVGATTLGTIPSSLNFRSINTDHSKLNITRTDGYRYHWVEPTLDKSGNTGLFCNELTFYEDPISGVASATGNFTSNIITASSSKSKMGAIITYQDQIGTNTLNTDIVLQLSADNGSNFTTATLSALPNYSTGIKMAKVNDLVVTAGTQLKYRISFANQSASKEARIRGVSLQY